MKQTIPVLNLNDFLSDTPEKRGAFVQDLGRALSDIGFFALENHGVDYALISDAYKMAETFFSLPEINKREYEVVELRGQRGFTSYGREHAKDHPVADLKEFWHVGRELAPENPLYNVYPKNFWPTELPEFKPVFYTLYQQLETCSKHLLDACSLYIGQPEKYLRGGAADGDSILRVIHYPPVPETAHPAAIRAAAHEDINLITLLCESTDDGLELLKRDGSWLPIRSLKGQIIVDAGDMLQNVTNGFLKSTTHRVVNPDNSRARRFSMPYFVHPRPDFDLSPLAGCIERTGGGKTYLDLNAGQYLSQRLEEIGLGK